MTPKIVRENYQNLAVKNHFPKVKMYLIFAISFIILSFFLGHPSNVPCI